MVIFFGMFTACSTNTDDQGLEVVSIEVTPENHTIVKGESKKFTALAVTSNGDKIPFAHLDESVWTWEWTTTDPQIATFDNSGLATGHEVGQTICWISLTNSKTENSGNFTKKLPPLSSSVDFNNPQIQRINFTGRDSFGVQVVNSADMKAAFNLN